MNASEFRKAAHAAIDEIADYMENVHDRPVAAAVEPGYLRALLPHEPPVEGEPWNEIQKDIETKLMPGMTHWQSPDFMGFFPTAFSYPALLGEMYSTAFSSPGFTWYSNPVMTELEIVALDWLSQILHLPACFRSGEQGGGVIQGSASEATLTTMVAAREKFVRRACEGLVGKERDGTAIMLRSRLVALGSDQSHSGVEKAAIIAGVKYRPIPTRVEDGFAVTGDGYKAAVEKCRADGLEPFHVTATLGTTGTCAVDDSAKIVAGNEGYESHRRLWIHVDAAWAGATLILDDYAHLAAQCSGVDSFDMNMHKWLLVNFDCSCLYVRNKCDLTDALSNMPAYMRNKYSESGHVTDFRDWQIPFGRRFRSLKLWFVMRSYGIKGMQAHIERHLDLGDTFTGWIRGRQDLFRIVTPPAFALTVFSIQPTGRGDNSSQGNIPDANQSDAKAVLERSNILTREVYEEVNGSGKLFLTKTIVNGMDVIRVVSGNYKTNESSLRAAFDLIVEIAERAQGQPL